MKLKLFFISIFVLFALVAYQTYRNYFALKSIDSYESCIIAKGSIIQTTYPTKCITALGTEFAQVPKMQDTSNWEAHTDVNFKYSIKYPPTYSVTTYPGTWLTEKDGPYRVYIVIYPQSNPPVTTEQVPDIFNLCTEKYPCTEYKSSPIINSLQFTDIDLKVAHTVLTTQDLIFMFTLTKPLQMKSSSSYKTLDSNTMNIYNQILSTFKFTN
ncbi:MAG: hypothetical protein WAV40_00200 [Microgenomates group bacterium]